MFRHANPMHNCLRAAGASHRSTGCEGAERGGAAYPSSFSHTSQVKASKGIGRRSG